MCKDQNRSLNFGHGSSTLRQDFVAFVPLRRHKCNCSCNEYKINGGKKRKEKKMIDSCANSCLT